jgi:membrane associated rhomboid family serine protease
MSIYSKAIAALTGALSVLGFALEDGTLTTQESVTVAIAVVTAFGVFAVQNKPTPDA